MGSTPTKNLSKLKKIKLSGNLTLFDLFYTVKDGKVVPKIGNVYIADSTNANGVGALAVRTKKVDNSNRVQADFVINTSSGKKGAMNVTFSPNNKNNSLSRTLINLPGAGGWGVEGVKGYKPGQYKRYCLDNDDGYMTINIQGCSAGRAVYKAAYNVSEQIQKSLGNVSDDHRYVISGASAGATSTVQVAETIITSRGSKNHSPIDIMLLDGARDCGDFVNAMSRNKTVKNEMVRTGSIIYAYESYEWKGKAGPRDAIRNLGNLADQGLIVVEKDPSNGGYPSHSGSNSNEKMLSNGESRKVVNESFSSTNESNYYRLILPGKQKNGNYSTKKITEKQLSNYTKFRKAIGVADKKTFLDAITNKDLNVPKSSTDKNSKDQVTGETTTIDYQSVVNDANGVISSINKTTFRDTSQLNYHFCENSTCTFPESLNNSTSYLFATSGNLLNNIATDIQNIGEMLQSYSDLDTKLANKANELNNGLSGNQKSSKISIDYGQYVDTDSLKASLFNESFQKGKAGKISASDINSMLNGNSLGGKLGEALNAEISDAQNLKSSLQQLLNNSTISSPDWSEMKKRLEKYSDLCDSRMQAAQTLEDAYAEALKLIKDYMEPDEYLDDGEIGSYEEKKAQSEKAIEDMKAENEVLATVQPDPIMGRDADGHEIIVGYDYTPVERAKAKIAENIQKIVVEEANIKEYNRILDKLYGWSAKLNEANGIVEDAVNKVKSSYADEVNSMNPADLGASGTEDNRDTTDGTTFTGGGSVGDYGGGGGGGSSGGESSPTPQNNLQETRVFKRSDGSTVHMIISNNKIQNITYIYQYDSEDKTNENYEKLNNKYNNYDWVRSIEKVDNTIAIIIDESAYKDKTVSEVLDSNFIKK